MTILGNMQRFIFFDCQLYKLLMTKFIFIFFFVIALSSCKKSEPTGVRISIENNTSFALDSVKLVYDTTNYNYGTILPGKATEYIFFIGSEVF